MRVLVVSLLAFFMVGCSINEAPHEPGQPKYTDLRLKKPVSKKMKTASESSRVRLYTQTEDLLGKPFRDLGIVLGQNCRGSVKSVPASIPAARQQMLRRAGKMRADAVLLHQCEIITSRDCEQLAVCEGTAIKVDDV